MYTPSDEEGATLFVLCMHEVCSDSLGQPEEASGTGPILLASRCKAREHPSHSNMLDLAPHFPQDPQLR